ncbi:THO complex subunit 2 isoform X2 [Humulus lupulus]|uniref:THO complex subunit 2 isoform X2 n=1 Tax=Humulus lupulus TaxID=3486 RepID=UPI002B4118F0|nr:THO complex subunit 2 isoform X2 [Humulus lupulus]
MSLPPVQCLYVTEDCLREWKAGNPSFKLHDPVPMLRFLYELCSSMARGELPLQKCKVALDSVMFTDKVSAEEIGSSLADIVTQMAQDLTMPGEYRARLTKLAKWLVDSGLVPLRLLHERCEEEFLWEAEMIKIKAQELKSKEVRVNTRLLYQQTKFNLLREESEGYAKLVTLLCGNTESSSCSVSGATIGIIKSLIGHFDLDPNRVFDIVLECFELQPDNNDFLDLIPLFPKSHAAQILGFKFLYYQRMEVNSPVPFGLYKLTALLVKEDFIDLDSIYAHLLPQDDEAFEHYNVFSSKRLDEARKIGKINLAATGKDLMDDEKQGDVTIDLFTALAMETEAVAERIEELENNQTLGLLSGFLSVDDWYHANILFGRLSHLNPVEHIQICNSLFRLIERSISSVYKTVHQAHLQNIGSSSGASLDAMDTVTSSVRGSFIDLPKEFFQMLVSAGPYLYRDTLLLQKVCRVLRGFYLSALELVGSGGALANSESVNGVSRDPRLHLKEARLRIEEALGTCLLPSLQLIPANPAVGQEIWEVMNLLPYEVRYRLYGEWEKEDERMPMLLAARQIAKLDTRRILKRLAKENLKQLGRMVAKLAHANPMTVLRTIVHQIEAYRDMIAPVVDAFKYLTQLEYDILEYVVIERLAQGGRDKLKDDGLNLSDWLQSLASFWGHLCKKYPSMELRGLFQYLVNQLKKGLGIELVLLQELIQQMANVQYTENLTEEQLDSMAGSETLRYQATSFGATRNNKALIKSTNRLRDSLLPKDEPKLAIPLLLLIAQHRSLVVINADAPYIKMVSEQFDRCHGTLLQYVEFLSSSVTPASAYAQLIPSLDDLVRLYHLDPEVAFLIYRPVMRLFKIQGSSDIFWPLDSDPSSVAIANSDSEHAEHSGDAVLDLGPSRKPLMWSDLLNTVKTMLPSKAWNSLSPDLYTTFWGLTLYDLYVPRNRYESEISKQHAALKALEEFSDNSSSAITKRKKDKERIQESLDRLTSELHKHEENVASVRRRLFREKDNWLSSCPDTLKINMEFLQRCIFPRCTFSMPDAVYCAAFVHTLHSLGTPFFNTVNHIDVLICKTLQPMICCCTEYEAGRLGRFLYETLKLAYHWKSDESIYERECGNMPGFAVYYRYPNSQRVNYGQFIKVHWKWSQRITRLLIQCLESSEYMEIRNSLILLTKISSVFPVTRKSGINLEKRVSKIKSDEREDLKVLATGVAAALAARKPSWVTDEEFGMGYLELKPAPSLAAKSSVVRDQMLKARPADGRTERAEIASNIKSDPGSVKLKGSSLLNGTDAQSSMPLAGLSSGASRSLENHKLVDDSMNREEIIAKVTPKNSVEPELRTQTKRAVQAGSLVKPPKQDLAKEDGRSGKSVGRASGSSTSDRDITSHTSDGRLGGVTNVSSAVSVNGNTVSASTKASVPSTRASDIHSSDLKLENAAAKASDSRISALKDDGVEALDAPRHSSSRPAHSPRHDSSTASKSNDKLQKRSSPAEEADRLNKRRKGETEVRDFEGDVRHSDRERSVDARFGDLDKFGTDEQSAHRATDKLLDRSKDKASERHDKDYKERSERSDKSRGDDLAEKPRDRSMERYSRERSVERAQERNSERNFDRLSEKAKEDRSKARYNDTSVDKSHADDRFHGQSLPPPPPLPPHMIPQSVNAGRRDEDVDRKFGTTRHSQRLSPRHEEKERRRSEESLLSQDDAKRRREDDFRDRKREDREGLSMKVEERDREREREREKANLLKEDIDASAASKRRKLKRDHLTSGEAGEYLPVGPPPPSNINISQSFDGRDRGDRKGAVIQRAGYLEEPSLRVHGKEMASKMTRRDIDPMYEREWDDEKRQRAEQKRRHRK